MSREHVVLVRSIAFQKHKTLHKTAQHQVLQPRFEKDLPEGWRFAEISLDSLKILIIFIVATVH